MKRSFFSLMLTLLIISCKKEKNRICELYSGPKGYEIGTVTKYVATPGKVIYSNSYSVNGNVYEGKERAYGIGQKNERLLEKDFLVVYNTNNPQESDLNKDFPLKSKAELQQLQNKFFNQPPEPDWPKCK